jgi:hypothetical protein
MKNKIEEALNLQVWFFLQAWFMPYYIIGKQDEWKGWAHTTLNGWRGSNLCKPY